MPTGSTSPEPAHQASAQRSLVEPSLEDFGLQTEHLHNAVRDGVHAALQINRYYPVTARGFDLWANTVASLRKQLSDLGWTLTDERNSPRAVDPEGERSIMVAAGDQNTGRPDTPRFARRRGEATRASVEANGQGALDLGPLPDDSLRLNQLRHRNGTQGQPETWVLLYCWAPEERRVQLELSLPHGMNEAGQVTSWNQRIRVEDLLLDEELLPEGLDAAAAEQDVDFLITEVP